MHGSLVSHFLRPPEQRSSNHLSLIHLSLHQTVHYEESPMCRIKLSIPLPLRSFLPSIPCPFIYHQISPVFYVGPRSLAPPAAALSAATPAAAARAAVSPSVSARAVIKVVSVAALVVVRAVIAVAAAVPVSVVPVIPSAAVAPVSPAVVSPVVVVVHGFPLLLVLLLLPLLVVDEVVKDGGLRNNDRYKMKSVHILG